jgi:hypothetical protein
MSSQDHPERGPNGSGTSMLCPPAQLYYFQNIAVPISKVMRMQLAALIAASPLPYSRPR